MNRVFIQVYCKYPHGEALANYIQNLARACVCAGYQVILATDINNEYDLSLTDETDHHIEVIPVVSDQDMQKRQKQKSTGFCDERIGVLKEHGITRNDIVFVVWLRNEYFLGQLFALRRAIGFKIICGILEMFGAEDYKSEARYREIVHIEEEVYLQSDAILSISEYIDRHYMEKGMKVYRFPPMTDAGEYALKPKKMDKYRFVIISGKDSLESMLRAFTYLEDGEATAIELHLFGLGKNMLNEILTKAERIRLMRFSVVHEWLRYKDLIELYQKMHFMVLARGICQRTLANFPSKVPEVMNCGVVPIVSDVGDYTKYYLKDAHDSIFIQGDSADEVFRAVRKALSMDGEEYRIYSANAAKTARDRFDYHVWVPKVREMLVNV